MTDMGERTHAHTTQASPLSEARANKVIFRHRRSEAPLLSSPYKHAPMPMPRPPQPRSLPSSSSVSVASRRSPTSPRLAAFCLSGTSKHVARAIGYDLHLRLGYWDREGAKRTTPFIALGWDQWRILRLTGSLIVMVSLVCTVWPTSRPRSWSSMLFPLQSLLDGRAP